MRDFTGGFTGEFTKEVVDGARFVEEIVNKLPYAQGAFLEGIFLNSSKFRSACKALKESEYTSDKEKATLDDLVREFRIISNNAFSRMIEKLPLDKLRG